VSRPETNDDVSEWLPYRAKLNELEQLLLRLFREKEMFRKRCLEVVKMNDLQRDEIENLRAAARAKARAPAGKALRIGEHMEKKGLGKAKPDETDEA
jgi:hypothetical protein